MNHPGPGDYIDIHNHDSFARDSVFTVDTLMAHEGKNPVYRDGIAYSVGVHPWFLTEANQQQLLDFVKANADNENVVAIGEAGYDRLKGPSSELQRKIFEEQVRISDECRKPLVIHCVRSWDELLASHKRMKPAMPWLVHGFRGKKELAAQLTGRGIFLSFWFDFILRPESSDLVRSLPRDRIFLETDGSGVSIKEIYLKVASDLGMGVDELKNNILENYKSFFSTLKIATD